jgi:hypothetical protein
LKVLAPAGAAAAAIRSAAKSVRMSSK